MLQLFYRYTFILLLLAVSVGAWAQGTQTTFGKNRVQYHTDFDEWSQYEESSS